MSSSSFEVSKLKISEVLSEAIILFKNNYRLFIKITLIVFLIKLLSNTLDVFQYLSTDTTFRALYKLFLFIIMFPFLYYDIKFSIATYACIADRYKQRNIDVKGSIKIASEKFWRYVGVNIQFFLIMLIPIAGVVGPFLLVKDILLKWAIIVLFAIPSIYIGTIYGFAPLMVITEKEKKQYFTVSKRLVDGDLLKIILLTLIVMTAFSIPYYLYMYVLNDYKSINPVERYIISSINQLLFVFVTPFTYSVYVVLYYKLKGNKRIG